MTHAGLAQAKVDYMARPRDENGKVKTTKGQGFSLWRSVLRMESAAERRKAKAVKDFRALDVDGNGTLSHRQIFFLLYFFLAWYLFNVRSVPSVSLAHLFTSIFSLCFSHRFL